MRKTSLFFLFILMFGFHLSEAQHWRRGYFGQGKKIYRSLGLLADYSLHHLNNRDAQHEYQAGNNAMLGLNGTGAFSDYAGFSVGLAYHELNFSETYKGYFGGNAYNELNVRYKLHGMAIPLSLLFSRRRENFIFRLSYTPVLFNSLQSGASYTGNISDIHQQHYLRSVFDFRDVRQQVSAGIISRIDFDNAVLNIEPTVGFMFNPEINSFNAKGYAPVTFGLRLSFEYVNVINTVYNKWAAHHNEKQKEKKRKLEEKKRMLEEKLKNELNKKNQDN